MMKTTLSNLNRFALVCIGVAFSMFGCSEDSKTTNACDKTDAICAEDNLSFDAENCECITKACNKTEETCAEEGKNFDIENCECITKECDKTEESCTEEGKNFDAENCECTENKCEKTEESCAEENKSFVLFIFIFITFVFLLYILIMNSFFLLLMELIIINLPSNMSLFLKPETLVIMFFSFIFLLLNNTFLSK